jgi:hypothetical protein
MFPVPPQVRRKRTPIPLPVAAPSRVRATSPTGTPGPVLWPPCPWPPPVRNYLPPAFAHGNRTANPRTSKRTVGPHGDARRSGTTVRYGRRRRRSKPRPIRGDTTALGAARRSASRRGTAPLAPRKAGCGGTIPWPPAKTMNPGAR